MCHFRNLAFVVFILVTFTACLVSGQSSNSSCTAKKTCGECIRSPDCVWCAQPVSHKYKFFVLSLLRFYCLQN